MRSMGEGHEAVRPEVRARTHSLSASYPSTTLRVVPFPPSCARGEVDVLDLPALEP